MHTLQNILYYSSLLWRKEKLTSGIPNCIFFGNLSQPASFLFFSLFFFLFFSFLSCVRKYSTLWVVRWVMYPSEKSSSASHTTGYNWQNKNKNDIFTTSLSTFPGQPIALQHGCLWRFMHTSMYFIQLPLPVNLGNENLNLYLTECPASNLTSP